ncbi:MAG TPA: phosphatase PAP2 family protein [Vicinamibacteria bacterium]|nr:phosphatase PAP2 family protein [Vicinamibacteria bacterium]
MALAPVDRATLAYLAVALVFTLLRGPLQPGLRLTLVVALLAAALVAGWLAPRARRSGPFGQLLGEFYPLLLTLGLYTHVGLVNRAAGVSHDLLVQGWEQALFGGQVSLAWVRAFPSRAWSTLMHAAYVSYYAILVASPLGLWLKGRRAAARRALLLLMVAFYVCYATSLAFPVAGPRYLFPSASNSATAVAAAALVRSLLETFSAWGTAFPSSHVAAALVAAVTAWRGWRPLGAVLIPLALLLTLSTVYGQLHYAVDAVAGGAVAAAVLLLPYGRQYDAAPGTLPGPRRTP